MAPMFGQLYEVLRAGNVPDALQWQILSRLP
jgi:hypothetical protein